MTFAEKSTIIAALSEYESNNRKKADRARKKHEFGKARDLEAEANKAGALMHVFCKILPAEPGSVSI